MTPLRQRMLEDMSIRNFAQNTQQSYVQRVSSFARYFHCSPNAIGLEKVREYQVHLVEDCKLAPSSTSIAVSALRFVDCGDQSTVLVARPLAALKFVVVRSARCANCEEISTGW